MIRPYNVWTSYWLWGRNIGVFREILFLWFWGKYKWRMIWLGLGLGSKMLSRRLLILNSIEAKIRLFSWRNIIGLRNLKWGVFILMLIMMVLLLDSMPFCGPMKGWKNNSYFLIKQIFNFGLKLCKNALKYAWMKTWKKGSSLLELIKQKLRYGSIWWLSQSFYVKNVWRINMSR